jgi:hypothetical protein
MYLYNFKYIFIDRDISLFLIQQCFKICLMKDYSFSNTPKILIFLGYWKKKLNLVFKVKISL